MFNLLVSSSLRNRLFVLAAALVLVAYGSYILPRVPVDVFPDLNRPTVTLMTEAEGLAPQEVEQLVTYPLETAMNGMPGVTRVRSVSGVGPLDRLCGIRLGHGHLPVAPARGRAPGARRRTASPRGDPQMGPVTSIMGEIMLIAVTATRAPMEVREIATS
jgi:HME family heavy-metal exporter